MKKPPLSVILLAFVFSLVLPGTTSQALDFRAAYEDGVRLYNEGDYKNALARFEIALRANPRSPHARSYMIKSKTAIAQGLGTKKTVEDDLKKILVPEINFEDAPIGDVLEYLAARAEEISKGKFRPNFIYKGTPEQRNNTLVTLSLRSVPMTEAIRYIGNVTRTHFRYEEHAVVADPNYVAPPNPALQKAAKEQAEAANTIFGEKPRSVFD